MVTDKDTHNMVTLTAVTLDGTDILSAITSNDNVVFQYQASGLSLGSHTVLIVAQDEAGNTWTGFSFSFDVTSVATPTLTPTPIVVPGVSGPGLGLMVVLIIAATMWAAWKLRPKSGTLSQ